MIAYHGDQQLKDSRIAQVRAHRLADQLIKGKYWEKGKGCAVGCTIHSSNHGAYETELGIPRILARLEDGIFESLPNEHAMLWPEAFLDAITSGANLSMVWPKFAVWMLSDPQDGMIRFAKTDRSRKAIQNVADAYAKVVSGEAANIDWRKLRADASAAAASAYADASAASAYADASAASAASAAADASADASAASADASAASAAADASAAYADASASAAADASAYADASAAAASAAADASAAAAREKYRIRQSEKLIELLKEAR